MTPPTAEERKAIRYDHRQSERTLACRMCGESWSCDTIRLLDALEAAEADRKRLRAALERIGPLVRAWMGSPTYDNALDNAVEAATVIAAVVTLTERALATTPPPGPA